LQIEIQGGCFCGAVRYRASITPLASMACHCNSCRRLTGAPMVAWLTFPKDQFQYSQGQPAQLHSSPGVLRTFCGACGTQLTYHNDKYVDEIDVTTSSLDDPAAFPPSHHSWMSHNVSWLRMDDGLPIYQRSRSNG
jgi:hypothetical protein